MLDGGLVWAVLRTAVPYTAAALGASISERAGLVNIAMEGFLLVAAIGTALGAAQGAGAAVACGLLAALLLALIYGALTVYLSADPVLVGVAVNLLADGLARFLLKLVYDSTGSSPRLPKLEVASLLPVCGLLLLLVLLLEGGLRRTVWGLRLRALGENPAAVVLAGGQVRRAQLQAVVLTGLLTAIGGVFLVLDQRQLIASMTGGRGYIGIAAMILGRAAPAYAALAALCFAAVEVLAIRLQLQALPLANWVVQLLPYLFAIALLAVRGGRNAMLAR